MSQENNIKTLIQQIVESHYDLIWTMNIKNATDVDEFEAWAKTMAKSHASITLRFMYSEDEFEQLYLASVDESAE